MNEHTMMKFLIVTRLTELIADKYKITVSEARDKVFKSGITELIENDNTGLYAESPLNIFASYEKRIMSGSLNN